ncbi:MAG: ABC transporter ATP-binding protein [Victivallaceae bacterium]|jgi:ATP-binding cassette subfamily C protein
MSRLHDAGTARSSEKPRLTNMLQLKLLRQLLFLFTAREKVALCGLLLLNVSCSLLEVAGIGAIVPFILMLSNPQAVENNRFMSILYRFLNPGSHRNFMIMLALLVIGFFIAKNLYMLGVFTCQQLFLRRKYINIADRLYATYIFSPYKFFFNRSTSELLRNVQVVQSIAIGMLTPVLNLLAEMITVSTILLFLLCIDPVKALIIAGVMGGMAGLWLAFVKKFSRRLGERRLACDENLISGVTQSLSSIKETRLLGTESFFQAKFDQNIRHIGTLGVQADLLSVSPRFYIESLTAVTVLAIMVLMLVLGRPGQTILVELTLLGMAAVRLMPSVTRMSVAIGNIRIYVPAFNEIYNDVISVVNAAPEAKSAAAPPDNFEFKTKIEMRNVFFSYRQDLPTLKNFSLEISRNQWGGFVGHSGSGKTTAADLLLGLLEPDSGQILVDGRDIRENLRGWQRKIGYIPQKIFVFNDTIRNNIALGLPPDEIDDTKVMQAVRTAQLEPLLAQLPDGLDSRVGEGGIKLSGGERQRIGIARALYRDPEILVMDEATAALDNETERSFMAAIRALAGQKTIICIAHRLTTVQNCDRIFFISGGKIAGSGTFDELVRSNPDFSNLAHGDNPPEKQIHARE